MNDEPTSVLLADQVQIGQRYCLAALPCGLTITFGRIRFKITAPPPYNVVSRSCQGSATVWNVKAKRQEKISYREKVKVIAKA